MTHRIATLNRIKRQFGGHPAFARRKPFPRQKRLREQTEPERRAYLQARVRLALWLFIQSGTVSGFGNGWARRIGR